jgi:photosystem II stability/assembly factor-like uncharacterized protein
MITKTIISLILFCSLFNLNLLSQSGWIEQASGTAFTLNSISFLNSNTGFAAGDSSVLLRTTNGGGNWQQLTIPLQGNFIYVKVFNSLVFAAINSQNSGYILKSTDMGNNWVVNNPTGLFRKVRFPDVEFGYALLIGNFLRTTNGGDNWSNHPMSFPVKDFSFQYQHSWCTAYQTNGSSSNNYLFMSQSQGLSWITMRIVQNVNNMSGGFEKLFFLSNDNDGICIYNDLQAPKKLMKTDNQGLNWVDCSGDGLNGDYLNISNIALNPNVWLVGDYVLKSTNAGDSWAINWNTNQFKDIIFINDNTGWLAGANGRIYKTTNGGIIALTPISGIVPSEYDLFQNYPNPFNPSTKIEFALMKSSHAKLEIYNSSGKLIQTLVNQQLQTGVYRVRWDAANFSSGVYFIKFTAGDFTKSNKMILLK